MSVNLQKGQKVDLTKGNTGLKTILVGLGWDEAPRKFSLFSKHEDIDCDASALLISAQTGKLNGPVDVVYFGNLTHQTGAVHHMGDNLTGEGAGDDAQVLHCAGAVLEIAVELSLIHISEPTRPY